MYTCRYKYQSIVATVLRNTENFIQPLLRALKASNRFTSLSQLIDSSCHGLHKWGVQKVNNNCCNRMYPSRSPAAINLRSDWLECLSEAMGSLETVPPGVPRTSGEIKEEREHYKVDRKPGLDLAPT